MAKQSDYLPDVRVQRAVLEATREKYRLDGYQAQVAAIAMKAQRPRDDAERKEMKDQLANLAHGAECAYAAARAMDEEIAKLPPDEGENAAP